MKTFINYIFTGFFLIISCIITSCIDDPVMPNGNFISGSIYDKYGLKNELRFDQYFVSPGNEPISLLESSSDFLINSFSSPYDLVITSSYTHYVLKFQDINIKNLSPVYHDENSSYTNWIRYSIPIKFPVVRKRTILYLKFLSESLYFQPNGPITVYKGDSLTFLNIYIPIEFHNKLNGNVLFLGADDISGYPYITFKKFGIKSLDSINFKYILEFSESDLSYDPPEVKSSFTNIPPSGLSGQGQVSLSFQGENSNLILYSGLPDKCAVNIPLLPGIKYNVTYTGLYNGGNLGGGTKDIIVSPGENGVVTHKLSPVIVSPAQNDSNVTANSDFKITDDNSTGVFMYEFFCYIPNSSDKKITIFSNRRTLKFSDICARGFEFQSGAQYHWRVIKIPGFINVDELLGTIYTTDPRYNSIEGSQFKAFFTR